MSFLKTIGSKLASARRIGSKVTGVIGRIGTKGGSILNKIGDAASVVPVLSAASPFLHAAGNFAGTVGGISNSLHGALDAKTTRQAVGYVGMAVAGGKQVRKQILERPGK
jgi:hypothetical protein